MLRKIRLTNFKGFSDVELDLSNRGRFEYGEKMIKNGICKTALIYGKNGTGKTNVGNGLFDIIINLSDTGYQKLLESDSYINAAGNSDEVTFRYEFQFGEDILVYEYAKTQPKQLLYETLYINNERVVNYNPALEDEAEILLSGAEQLRSSIQNYDISIIKYINSNTYLNREDPKVQVFYSFIKFVENMVYIRQLSTSKEFTVIGKNVIKKSLSSWIIDNGYLEDFNEFLNKSGVDCNLTYKETEEGGKVIKFLFENNRILDFFINASSGTLALSIFYTIIKSSNEFSFIYFDEYDAFYHYDLAIETFNECIDADLQILLSTHNVTIIEQEDIRPDCIFELHDGVIESFSQIAVSQKRELRKVHNLGKLYKTASLSKRNKNWSE